MRQVKLTVKFTLGDDFVVEGNDLNTEFLPTGNFLIVYNKGDRYVFPLDKIISFHTVQV